MRIASQSAVASLAPLARPICLQNLRFRLTANPLSGVMFQKVCLFIPIVPDEVIKIAQKIDLDQF